jgi:hypothetical protein
MDNKMLNRMAVPIPFTIKPSISLSANSIMIALIINRNKPSVKIVAGKVKIISIGFTNTLRIEITTATNNEVA